MHIDVYDTITYEKEITAKEAAANTIEIPDIVPHPITLGNPHFAIIARAAMVYTRIMGVSYNGQTTTIEFEDIKEGEMVTVYVPLTRKYRLEDVYTTDTAWYNVVTVKVVSGHPSLMEAAIPLFRGREDPCMFIEIDNDYEYEAAYFGYVKQYAREPLGHHSGIVVNSMSIDVIDLSGCPNRALPADPHGPPPTFLEHLPAHFRNDH